MATVLLCFVNHISLERLEFQAPRTPRMARIFDILDAFDTFNAFNADMLECSMPRMCFIFSYEAQRVS